jgi:Protein of unknown function (DUF3891)
MLFRALSMQYGPQEEMHKEVWPAARAFVTTQEHVSAPFAIILQTEHARLAGDLAVALSPDLFGELPSEVIEAIRQHDAGWIQNDTSQLEALREREPLTFMDLPPEKSLPAWQSSIQHAASISSLAMTLVSRHFCLLATGDPLHKQFREREEQRRRPVEQDLDVSAEELNRWTGALGFCDLLSLYLCSGSKVPVAFPLCHPAAPDADSARKVILSWQENQIIFSSSVIRSPVDLTLNAVLYRGQQRETESSRLHWSL